MPTPLDLINAPGARRGVVVYRPAAQRPGPTRRTTPPRPRPPTEGGRVAPGAYERVMSTPAARAQREEEAQQVAEDQAWDDTPIWGKGLGVVLGNPLVKNALIPLGALGTLGRGVVLGVEEAAENLPEWAQGPLSALVDTERTEADTRSNWSKVFNPQSDYGFGQLLDPDMSPWLSRPLGFLGDTVTDPLTYVTGGVQRVPAALSKGAKLQEAAAATAKVDNLFDDALRAAEAGDYTAVARLGNESASTEAMARRLIDEANDTRRTSVAQERRGRASLQAELAEFAPDMLERYGPELQRAGQRGFNTIKDQELRDLLGLADPRLRWLGMNVPGTRRLAQRGAHIGGGARALVARTPAAKIGERLTAKGIEGPLGVLTRGKQGDVLRSATAMRVYELFRRGAQSMEARGNTEARLLSRSMEKAGLGPDEVRALFRQAEIDDQPNAVNLFFQKMATVYERVSNTPMHLGKRPNHYVPHMMSPEFKRFLAANRNNQSVEDYMRATQFVESDLLEASHHLDKARKLTPDELGKAKDFKIGDRTITLQDGSIDELNEQLALAFPEFKGKAYMDDPVKVAEAYISSISHSAGKDFALDRIAKSPNPLVHQIAGELLEAVENRNAWARTNPIVEKVKAGYTAGQNLVQAKPKGDMPTSPYDAMLGLTVHTKESDKARRAFKKAGRGYVTAVGRDVSGRQATLAENLKGLRSTLMNGLEKKAKNAEAQITVLNLQLERVDDEIKKVGKLDSGNVDELVSLSSTIDATIADVEAEIRKINARYGRKLPKDQAKIKADLEAAHRRLDNEAKQVRSKYEQGSAEMRAEAARRKEELERPMRLAQIAYDRAVAEAKAARPFPVAPERTHAANAAKRAEFETEEQFEAEIEIFRQALRYMQDNGMATHRRIDGRMTEETFDQLQQVVSEIKRVDEPAAATVPPAAAAPSASWVPSDLEPNVKYVFRGEKGSVYQVLDDGSSIRDRAAGARGGAVMEGGGMEAQLGAERMPRMDQIRFVDPDDGLAISRAQAAGVPFLDDQGRLLGLDVDPASVDMAAFNRDRAAGMSWREAWERNGGSVETRVINSTPDPAVGLQPIEFSNDGSVLHPGHNVVEVHTPTSLVPEPVAAAASESPPVPTAGPTSAQYAEARDVLQNSLVDIVDEENLDQVDAIYTLSDRDTAQLAGEMWDSLPPAAQQRLTELGITPPEQAALPAAVVDPEIEALEAQLRQFHELHREAIADDDMELVDTYETALDMTEQRLRELRGAQETSPAEVGDVPVAPPAGVAAAEAEQTPPVAPGMVRLYRGEYADPRPSVEEARAMRAAKGLDWINESEQMQARDAVQGRWFHPDLNVASSYPMDPDPGAATRISYIDVPEEMLPQLRQWDPATAGLSRDPAEALIPEELMGQVSEFVAPPAITTPEPSPPARVTTPGGWKKREVNGREVQVGPGGWSIEPFERSHRPTVAEIQESGLTVGGGEINYIAYHPTDRSLVGRSYTSVRDAKLAVQDVRVRQARRITMEEYTAGSEMSSSEFIRHIRGLPEADPIPAYGGGPRTVPGEPRDPARIAERTRAQAEKNIPRPERKMQPPPAQYAETPQGQILRLLAPSPEARAAERSDPYRLAFNAWKEMERRIDDPALTQAERNAAKRQARSMGGDFTQKNGKYYNRHNSEKLFTEQLEWQGKIDADPKVAATRVELDRVKAQTDRQVEAIVYTREYNPETGIATETRLPAGSLVGFAEGTERVPVQITPPTQGDMPVSASVARDPKLRRMNYSAGQRARDRRILEEGVEMPFEPQEEYINLSIRKEAITERLDAAARNEDELNRLDEAAKAAYSSEVKAADQAVLEAKAVELRARNEAENFGAEHTTRVVQQPGMRHEEAQRVLQRALDRQTEARQAWMEADRAWRAKLAERDEYRQVQANVARVERAINQVTESAYDRLDSKGRKIPGIIDQVRRGETPTLGNQPIKNPDTVRLIQELQRADIELDEFEAAGFTYLTDTERRDLAGQLVSIDVTQRELIEQVAPSKVRQAGDVLEFTEPYRGEAADLFRGGTSIPAVRGTGDDLQARAFAEHFEPTEPTERTVWQLDEQGALRGTPQPSPGSITTTVDMGPGRPPELRTTPTPKGRQQYVPRTEREAQRELRKSAERIERGLQGPEQEALDLELANVERTRSREEEISVEREAEAVIRNKVDQDKDLLPFKDQLETYTAVRDALVAKAKLIPQRDAAQAERAAVVKAKVTQKADLVKLADEIEGVAKANPDLLDDGLAVTEALLHETRREAKEIGENDLTRKQVQGVLNDITNKKSGTLDIMLTTTAKGWDMVYDTVAKKGDAVLKEGDTIIDSELNRMFKNIYEIRNDRILLGRTFNALTNLFKTYATLTPGFHIRNAISAIFMNSSDGVAMRHQFNSSGLWRQYMKGGDDWLDALPGRMVNGMDGQQVQDAFTAAFSSGAGGRFTEAGFAEAPVGGGGYLNFLERGQRNMFTRASQRAGQRVEGSVRLAMALDSMAKGQTVESAIQRITRIHFDYNEVSRLDEHAKRLIPFWTFMSRNMPMQVSQMWTHPRLYLGYERFVNNFAADNEEYTPAYWLKGGSWNSGLKVPQNSLPIAGAASNLPIYAAPDLGFTRLASDLKDYEDFLSLERPGGVLSQFNPLLTVPVELATRKDIFTGQEFEVGETVAAKGPVNWPIQLAAILARQRTDGEVDASFANAMRAINPLQDRSLRLLPQAGGGDEEGMKRQLESLARTLLGVPGRTLTPKQQENERLRQYYDRLDEINLRRDRNRRRAG